MSTRILSSADALLNFRGNEFGEWPENRNTANRIEPLCKPQLQPTFHLEPGEKIFTIGSCFATNVEKALVRLGFDAVRSNDSARKILQEIGVGALTNFGVPSIFNDFDWALNPDAPFEEDSFIQTGENSYVDVHVFWKVKPRSLESVKRSREGLKAVNSRVKDCRVVIITLGLTECWFDTKTGRYLNTTPLRSILQREEGRFELHVLDYPTVISYLRKAIETLKTYCRADQRVMLTVSPIPLFSTYTDQDVLIANTYSKSVLRSVAEVVSRENDHVDYFPAYESVTLSERSRAWCDVLHHPTDEIVELNVSRMIAAYSGQATVASGSPDLMWAKAKEAIRSGDHLEALVLMDAAAEAFAENGKFQWMRAQSCFAVGRAHEALAILEHLKTIETSVRALLLEARIRYQLGDRLTALQCSEQVTVLDRRSLEAWTLASQSALSTKQWERGIVAASNWIELSPRRSAAWVVLGRLYDGLGRLDAAEEAFLEALAGDKPGSAYVHYVQCLLDQRKFPEIETFAAKYPPKAEEQLEIVDRARRMAARFALMDIHQRPGVDRDSAIEAVSS